MTLNIWLQTNKVLISWYYIDLKIFRHATLVGDDKITERDDISNHQTYISYASEN